MILRSALVKRYISTPTSCLQAPLSKGLASSVDWDVIGWSQRKGNYGCSVIA